MGLFQASMTATSKRKPKKIQIKKNHSPRLPNKHPNKPAETTQPWPLQSQSQFPCLSKTIYTS